MKRHNISLVDLVNIFHPKGTEKNAEAYKRLINGESLEGLYTSKVLEKEMSKAGKAAKTEEEKIDAKAEAIASVLENPSGMPMMNLLRNLRNIILYAPDKVDEAVVQLTIEEKVLNSRLLPFRFATAYAEIEKMQYEAKKPETSIAFESEQIKMAVTRSEFEALKSKVLDAIEDAIQTSCLNIPKLEGNCAILIDHSGSVRGDGGGNSRVSAFSATRRAMIGNLFGSMVAYRQDNVYIGLFGDRLINVPIDRSKKLLDFNKESYDIGAECGGGTETGIYDFLRQVIAEKKKIDNVIVFSDCQIGNKSTKHSQYSNSFTSWYGSDSSDRGNHFHELFKEFRKINPNANFIVCNINQSGGTSVFDKSQRILNIAGWSNKIFDAITSNCKGWDTIIKEIEAITI
jgi:60 kDa SS-A/Ro ribonucleoprotein